MILAVLADEQPHHTDDLQAVAARHFRLTDAELRVKRANGHFEFQNEHAFGLSLLVQDRMIEQVDRPSALFIAKPDGWYKATGRGLEVARQEQLEIRR